MAEIITRACSIHYFLYVLLYTFLPSGTSGNGTTVFPKTDTIRLVGAGSHSSGIVEVLVNNQWGAICDNSLDADKRENFALVVCRQIGLNTTVNEVIPEAGEEYWQYYDTIFFPDIRCKGSEARLEDCYYSQQRDYNCGGGKLVAGVKCFNGTGDEDCCGGSYFSFNYLSWIGTMFFVALVFLFFARRQRQRRMWQQQQRAANNAQVVYNGNNGAAIPPPSGMSYPPPAPGSYPTQQPQGVPGAADPPPQYSSVYPLPIKTDGSTYPPPPAPYAPPQGGVGYPPPNVPAGQANPALYPTQPSGIANPAYTPYPAQPTSNPAYPPTDGYQPANYTPDASAPPPPAYDSVS